MSIDEKCKNCGGNNFIKIESEICEAMTLCNSCGEKQSQQPVDSAEEVERVARALCLHEGDHHPDTEYNYDGNRTYIGWTAYVNKARAAISAMKREIVDLREYQGGFAIGDEVEYIGQYKNDDGWKGETFFICEVKKKYQSYSGDYFFEYTITEKHKWKATCDGLFISDLRLVRATNEIEV